MKRLWVAACLIAAVPTQSFAQALAATHDYKVVARGQRVEMDHLLSLDPDCRSLGATDVNLLAAPRGGSVQIGFGRSFPSYAATNVRSRCNTRRLPSTIVYYRARPDFVGFDSFDAEVVFPDGTARRIRYGVTVR